MTIDYIDALGLEEIEIVFCSYVVLYLFFNQQCMQASAELSGDR